MEAQEMVMVKMGQELGMEPEMAPDQAKVPVQIMVAGTEIHPRPPPQVLELLRILKKQSLQKVAALAKRRRKVNLFRKRQSQNLSPRIKAPKRPHLKLPRLI